jgi:branched-chain amino acid transport system permease protein
MEFDRLISFWGHHFVMLAIWVTLTLSLNLINGFCGLFSLGHQGFWAIGAYAAGATLAYLPASIGASWTGFALSFAVGILAAAVFGFIVGLPCLRLKGDYLAIATLGFSEILRNVIQNSTLLGQSLGLSVPNVMRQHMPEPARRNFYIAYLFLAWVIALGTLVILRNLIHSAHGRAIQAIRDDERAAELVGVNLTYYKMLVFVTGAAFAGLAGALFANYNAFVTPDDFNFNAGVLMVVMVVLGGMGSFTGTILATTVLYFAPVLLSLWLPTKEIPVFWDPTQGGVVYREVKELWQVLFSLLLIVVVILRPQGIMGSFRFGRKRAPLPPSPPAPPGLTEQTSGAAS